MGFKDGVESVRFQCPLPCVCNDRAFLSPGLLLIQLSCDYWSSLSFFKNIFMFLAALSLSWCTRDLRSFLRLVRSLVAAYGNLVPQPRTPSIGSVNLSHWTTREVPE